MALTRRSGAASNGLDDLAELWIAGLTAPHDAGCGCGGMALPALDAGDIEDDLLAYLVGKYRNDAPDLAAFLAARRAAGDRVGFENWLSGLDKAPLTVAARERLVADLRTFLESLAGRGRPRIGICY